MGYTQIISISSVSPNSVIMQSIKLRIQRQSFIQNILDPKPNFELLLISSYCNSLKIEAHKTSSHSMTEDTSILSPWSCVHQGWMSGPCGMGLLSCPLQLFPVSSPFLQIFLRATKSDHGSARRQQGFICSYSAYSRLWSPIRAGDTWEKIFDRGHRTWPPSLFLWSTVLWLPCHNTFFLIADFDW